MADDAKISWWVELEDGFVDHSLPVETDSRCGEADAYLIAHVQSKTLAWNMICHAMVAWRENGFAEYAWNEGEKGFPIPDFLDLEPFSELWYLTKIYMQYIELDFCKDNIGREIDGTLIDVEEICERAIELGALCQEFRLSIRNKRLAIARRSQLRGQAESRESRNAASAAAARAWEAEARAIAADIWSRNSTPSAVAIAPKVREELARRGVVNAEGLTPSTSRIRKAIASAKPGRTPKVGRAV